MAIDAMRRAAGWPSVGQALQERVKAVPDHTVALARTGLEPSAVEHGHLTATIRDEAGALELLCDQADRWPRWRPTSAPGTHASAGTYR